MFLGDSLYGCGELFNCSQAGDYFGKFFSLFSLFTAMPTAWHGATLTANKNHKCLARIY